MLERIGPRAGQMIVAVALSLACAAPAHATDASGYFVIAIAILFVLAVGMTLLALWLCRFIANRRARAFVRLLILATLYTPVPPVSQTPAQTVPSFLKWSEWLTTHHEMPGQAEALRSMLLATGIVLVLGLAVLIAWFWVSDRYAVGSRRAQATPSAPP
jgi:small-conductance mechanosensitive channel